MTSIPDTAAHVADLRGAVARLDAAVGTARGAMRSETHRLNLLLKCMNRWIASITAEDPQVLECFISALAELKFHTDLLELAKGRLSDWDERMGACNKPETYDHLFLTLCVQKVIRDGWGISTEILPEVPDLRTPDLMMYRDGAAFAAVEVKTKAALIDPLEPLQYTAAQKVIKKALEKTGNSREGQLRDGFPCNLAIAGYFVDRTQLELLVTATRDWFKRNQGHRKSLAGIFLCSFTVYSKGEQRPDAPLGDLTPVLDVVFVPNPSYTLQAQFLPVAISGIKSPPFPKGYDRWAPDYVLGKAPTVAQPA